MKTSSKIYMLGVPRAAKSRVSTSPSKRLGHLWQNVIGFTPKKGKEEKKGKVLL